MPHNAICITLLGKNIKTTQTIKEPVNSEEVQRYIEQQEEHHKKDDFRISEF